MPPTLPPSGLKGSWDWLALAAQLPAKPHAPTGGLASGLVVSGRYLFKGLSLSNTAAGAGTIVVRDGQDATGLPIFYLSATANAVASSPFISDGILCENGIYISVTTLQGNVTLWIVPLKHYNFAPPGE